MQYWLGLLIPIQLTAGVVWRVQMDLLSCLVPGLDGKKAELNRTPLPLHIVSGSLCRSFHLASHTSYLTAVFLETKADTERLLLTQTFESSNIPSVAFYYWQVSIYGQCNSRGRELSLLPLEGLSKIWPLSSCNLHASSHLVLKTTTLWGRYP